LGADLVVTVAPAFFAACRRCLRFMAMGLKPQHHLGDDVALNFVTAAIDGRGAA